MNQDRPVGIRGWRRQTQVRQISLLGLALATVWAATVQAQTNAAPIKPVAAVFQSADTNSDGRVSLDEFASSVGTSTFARLDQDRDGVITLAEWKTVDHSPEATKHFEAVDKDRNGRISYPEFADALNSRSNLHDSFKSLDRDRDSHLAPDELTGRPMFQLLSVNF